MRKRALTMLVVLAFAVSLVVAPAALAHGAVDDGHEGPGWVSPALVLGGLVIFGGGAFVVLKRR